MPVVTIVLVLHVLAATFWAGSTFTLARVRGKGADVLFVPQMGAAITAVVAGAYLWRTLFGATPGHTIIGIGSIAAIVAALVQAVLVGRVRRRIESEPQAQTRAALAHRIAGGLLAVTIICMVIQ
jgi:hypothetical protein